MNNIWLVKSKIKKIFDFIVNNGAHHLRNCATFYHTRKRATGPVLSAPWTPCG
jgi:hypothetical protein